MYFKADNLKDEAYLPKADKSRHLRKYQEYIQYVGIITQKCRLLPYFLLFYQKPMFFSMPDSELFWDRYLPVSQNPTNFLSWGKVRRSRRFAP